MSSAIKAAHTPGLVTKTKAIAQIDKQLDAVTGNLKKLEFIDEMSAASWQAAWDKHPDLYETHTELYRQRGVLQLEPNGILRLVMHEHAILNSKISPAPRIKHSHHGGGIPHRHPNCGPSFYSYHGYPGYRGKPPKTTNKPIGEQREYEAMSEEESSFELVITDSAIRYDENFNSVPIGNTPIDQIWMPAADRMMRGSRLRCIVRDERTGREAGE